MSVSEREKRFEQWIENHQGVILKVVRANASDLEDQNDLYQEIARQLWLSLPSFQAKSKVSTWIYKVALNTAFVWHRERKKRRRAQESPDFVVDLADPRKDPSDSLETQEKLEWLYAAIRELPKADRSLALLYFDELSYQEIAEILEISPNHVGVKLHRLKARLTESYARRAK